MRLNDKRRLCGVQVPLTPDTFAAKWAALFGASLEFLYLGDDIVYSGANATSWPARAGNAMARVNGALVTATTVNGRGACTQVYSASDVRYLAASGSYAAAYVFAFARVDTVSSVGYQSVANFALPATSCRNVYVVSAQSTSWLSAECWERARAGVATNTLVYDSWALYGARSLTGLTVANPTVLGNTGTGSGGASVAMFSSLATVPNAATLAAAVALCQRYYGAV